jgi:Protein of unknown function (Hypoth_ymh)
METVGADPRCNDFLRSEVRAVSERAFDDGRYDEAIFAACRELESHLASRVGSSAIGGSLVDAAFDPTSSLPAIRLSNDLADTGRVNHLFKGVLGVLKGDRSHKSSPSIPCIDADMCLRALGCVSLMYDLLDLDLGVAPAIRAVRCDREGTLSIDCDRVTPHTVATFDGRKATVISRSGRVVTVAVPTDLRLPCTIRLQDDRRRSQPFSIDQLPIVAQAQGSFYRVQRFPVDLYADSSLSGDPVGTGVTVFCAEGARAFRRTLPAERADYSQGDYLQWDWSGTAGTYWYKDERGQVRSWNGPGVTGEVIGHAGPERIVSIELHPAHALLRVGERVPITVIAHVTDGVATWTEDVTHQSQVSSSDNRLALSTGSSIVGKQMGRATLSASFGSLFDAGHVTVGPLVAGEACEFLGGWRNPISIAALPNNELVFANQRSELWRLNRDHAVTAMFDRPLESMGGYGFDKCCAGADGRVYFSGPESGSVLCLEPDDGYQTARSVFSGAQVSAIAWTEKAGLLVFTFDRDVWRFDNADPYVWTTTSRLAVAAAGTEHGLWFVHGGGAPGYSTIAWDSGKEEGPLP